MTDILNSIDEVIAAVESCGCGCGQRITDRSASPFYASEACQTKWMQQGKDLKLFGSSRRARLDVQVPDRPRAAERQGPSVMDLMPHIVEWFNANGIPAIDVPVAEVAQLHDGQITVWTFERPQRFISETEGAARTLVTVPMAVSPPDVLQPWLRGECRESVPFVSAEMAEVDAVLRHVATRDRPAEEQRMEALVQDLPRGSMQLSGYFVGEIRCLEHHDAGLVTVEVTRADPYAYMSVELYENADPERLRITGDLISFGTERHGLGVVWYRIVQREEETDSLLLKRLCCDLHGRNCEQGGEECCDDCTERLHFAPGHGGLECSSPDLSGVSVAMDVSRDGTSTVALYDGSSYTVIDESHRITPEELEEAVQVAAGNETRRAWQREVLGEWPLDPDPEPRAPLLDAALEEPEHNGRHVCDNCDGTDPDSCLFNDLRPIRRPWWRFW